jgi:hypothetical protein
MPYLEYQQQKDEEAAERARNAVVIAPADVPDGVLRNHFGKLLDKVRLAPEGEKHDTRLRIGRAIGGYVAGGYLSRTDALGLLQDAALANTTNPALALADIEDAVNYGMADPLVFESRAQG